jgi:hypothetical protein
MVEWHSNLLVLIVPAGPIARHAFVTSAVLLSIVANYRVRRGNHSAAETITRDQDPDWRLHFIEERQVQIAAGPPTTT